MDGALIFIELVSYKITRDFIRQRESFSTNCVIKLMNFIKESLARARTRTRAYSVRGRRNVFKCAAIHYLMTAKTHTRIQSGAYTTLRISMSLG